MAAYRSLCERLGRATRFSLNVPPIEQGPGDVGVQWRCGCRADGESLLRIRLRPCALHASDDADLRAPAIQAHDILRPLL